MRPVRQTTSKKARKKNQRTQTRMNCPSCELPQDFDGLAKLLLDEVGLEAIRRCEEVVGLVDLVPRVGLRRDAELFHADLACTDGAVCD